MTRLWTRYASAAFAAALCGTAMGQLSTADSYDRCVNDSSAFASDAKLNESVTEYLTSIQKEIDSSLYISRVAGMAGLEDRSNQARSRANQYRQELQKACAHISQSMNETDQRPGTDQIAPAQVTQSAERQRQAIFERELNRRIPGAIFIMNEAGFAQWLDGKQGKTLRRDLWEQAIVAEDFEQGAQMLRDYERALKSK
jgi:hypothetical protein